jgi:hypothetical protein
MDSAKGMFPFRVFFDESHVFNRRLEVDRVPAKLFLEDGVVKKVWVGSTISDQSKAAFRDWLDGLK